MAARLVRGALFSIGLTLAAVAPDVVAERAGWPTAARPLVAIVNAAGAGACEALTGLTSGGVTVTTAQSVAAGALSLQGLVEPDQEERFAATLKRLPALCRMAATLKPSTDSDIKIEVWMPADGWNGKYLGVGNGGWSGAVSYDALADGVLRGYAVASTDTGHSGSNARFALGHPEKIIDFGYRAVHEMTVTAKKAVGTYYATPPRLSYWRGCSAGGKQGLKEAQRFPADYDGIVAGAPGLDWTGRSAQALRVWQAIHSKEATRIPPETYPLIHEAAVRACDKLDGVEDGVIENPQVCRFDPATIACKGEGTTGCLTPPQVEAARQVYLSTKNAENGRVLSGLYPGSELGWATWGAPRPFATAVDHFRYVIFQNADWNPATFDFAKDLPRADRADDGNMNALDPNLKPFFERGGKLVQYHGWSDPQISPGASVQYYERVVSTLGGRAAIDGSYRLFMVPGMAHCGGGEGTSTFDPLAALEAWVERKTPPASIPATRQRGGKAERSRPLCPYPQTAVYKGSGSIDEAANFVCKAS